MRKIPLVNLEYYHIFNRSIAGFKIFNESEDYFRMLDIISLFRFVDFKDNYANYLKLTKDLQKRIKQDLEKSSKKIVNIIAYCLMPTHPHLILKQNIDNGITNFMSRVLNSYSRYFNTKYHRKGPL